MSFDVPNGSVVVTPEMMYVTLNEVVQKVNHIETLLNPALDIIREDAKLAKAEVKETLDDHETRIRAVEKMSWKVLGASSVVSTLLAIVVVWLGKK